MEHHRLRKYRGPETWARVRAAYVAGEPAPSVARRFDVGLSNLRRRAMKEGWTRNRVAETLDRALSGERAPPREEADGPPDILAYERPPHPRLADRPDIAVARAMRRAARLLSHGRTVEAEMTIRTAERLTRLAEQIQGPSR